MLPAVALNVPLLDPALIVILPGTLNCPVLLESVTTAAPPAAFVSVTVQVEACPLPSAAGVQLNPANCAGASRFSVKVRVEPPPAAVITAVWSLLTEPTVAVNCALDEPEATVTLPGTVTFALSSDRLTANPPAPAALLNVTVQVELPGAFTLAGEQDRLLTTVAVSRLIAAVRVCPP